MKKNKVINYLIKILKGGLIGIATVIPGFSGGTIACICGIYDEIIGAVSNIFKKFKESFLTLLPFLIGIVVFALAFITPITWGIDNHPLITVSLFAGLLIGGLPSFYKNIQGKYSVKNILFFILGGAIILSVVIPSLFVGEKYISLTSPNVGTYFILIAMGFIASCALVVPGISGSMILLIIGYYTPIMDTIKAFFGSTNLIHPSYSSYFDTSVVGPSYIVPSLMLILCFLVGIVIGFIVISKIMKFLLRQYATPTYFAIFGFIIFSLVGIYAKPSYYQNITVLTIILSIVFLALGITISMLLFYLEAKKKKSEVQ